MKELKETKPLWAKKKSHLIGNFLLKRQEEPHISAREGSQQWCSAETCASSTPALCILNDLEDKSRLSVKTDDDSNGGKKKANLSD